VRGLGPVLRQGLVVEGTGFGRVEREIELVLPAEFEAGLAQRVVAELGGGMAFGEVGGVGQPYQPIMAAPMPLVMWS